MVHSSPKLFPPNTIDHVLSGCSMIANHVHSQLEIRRIEKNTMIVREIYIYIRSKISKEAWLARSIIKRDSLTLTIENLLSVNYAWRMNDATRITFKQQNVNWTGRGTGRWKMIKVRIYRKIYSWHIYTFSCSITCFAGRNSRKRTTMQRRIWIVARARNI